MNVEILVISGYRIVGIILSLFVVNLNSYQENIDYYIIILFNIYITQQY
jgi:hypothetical protein